MINTCLSTEIAKAYYYYYLYIYLVLKQHVIGAYCPAYRSIDQLILAENSQQRFALEGDNNVLV